LPRRFDLSLQHNTRKLELVESLVDIANELGTTLLRLAIRWSLEHPAVTSSLIGARTERQLEETIGTEDLELPTEVLDRLDRLVLPGDNVHSQESRWRMPHLHAAFRRQGTARSGAS
jgi:aryl-alcohol dehydrogenase-like predicted oxidoreductase